MKKKLTNPNSLKLLHLSKTTKQTSEKKTLFLKACKLCHGLHRLYYTAISCPSTFPTKKYKLLIISFWQFSPYIIII